MNEEQKKTPAQEPTKREEEILKFWNENDIFQKSLEKTKDNKPYVFYDGPPFATGLPHYGGILASVVKDVFGRYHTMKGAYVRRRWGWDCHGLPIEQLIEQKLGISGKKEIEALGIDKFNAECRKDILMYVDEWGKTVNRLGRFVEFKNSYKTMDSTYMESVWWALKQVWEKGLIYEGRKVLLYCPRCETPISNFEVAMDNSYDDVTEDSVYVKSELKWHGSPEKTYILFWTTTPWTLPGNVALAVGKDIQYVLIRPSEEDQKHGVENALYVLAKNKAGLLFNNPQILKEFKGNELVGASYQPMFDVPQLRSEKSFKVYDADFVTTEDGTGVVHTAVVYGEDDYNLGLRVGLPVVPMLDNKGVYNEVAPAFVQGKYHRDAEPLIIEELQKQNKLLKKEAVTHSVAFCWRCGTRLFYNAIPAWFINIQKIKPRLIELNQQQIDWYPEHLKNGRFGKGLENAPDWNISRNRYWATPLPFWKCSSRSCGRTKCIGSLKELRDKATNYDSVYRSSRIEDVDLHRPWIDQVKLECDVCSNEMNRIPEVVDCWVESASMPFAELHYPFENKELFEEHRSKAQFVAEYINQTRAWFYVMHVMSTVLFDHAPFENVVNTGVVLAEDGQKMSKSKKNFPDSWLIFERYGVDALRHYLMTSPVMLAENLYFSEKEIDEIYKKVILLLYNVLSFFRMYSLDKVGDGAKPLTDNILDQWILADLHELQSTVTENLDAYNTVHAGRPIIKFINELSTWYVRRSRDRIKGQDEEALQALATLGYVLVELAKLMAPFMPFIADYFYKDLTGEESVHLANWPKVEPISGEEKELLAKMESVRELVELGLSARKEANIKVRQPLSYVAYKFKNKDLQLSSDLEKILAEELNVKEVQCVQEIEEMPSAKLKESASCAVILGTTISPELQVEGYARELERQVQDMRKKFGLKVGDLIDLYYATKNEDIESALLEKFDRKKTFVSQIKYELEVEADFEMQADVDGKAVWLGLVKI